MNVIEGTWMEEDYQNPKGPYYSVLVKKITPEGKISVGYKDQFTIEYVGNREISLFLPGEVERGDLRPCPPSTDLSFSVGKHVDVFFETGWWPGVILSRNEEDFIVKFDHKDDQEEAGTRFSIHNIRMHQDYVDGEWIIG